MKVAITGANGFVGAALCKYFFSAGHQVIALGNQDKPNPKLLKMATYIKTDITKSMDLIDADVCIHTAALPSDTDTYKSLIISNVEGTLNVVEAARNCKFIIHISSSTVYEFEDEPVKEDNATIQSKLSDYGETKLLAEDILEIDIPSHQRRMILRPRAIYGIGELMLLPRLLKLISGNLLLCPVRDNIHTSLTHVDNIGYAIELFIDKKDAKPINIYNICDEKPYSLKDLMLITASSVWKKQFKPVYIPRFILELVLFVNTRMHNYKTISRPVVDSLNKNAVLDTWRIRKELGYMPQNTFDKTLPQIIKWIDSFGGAKEYIKRPQEALWASF